MTLSRDYRDGWRLTAKPGGKRQGMARLRFYPDERPGFTRRRAGRSYAFRDCNGDLVRDPDVRARILGLGIPPAWTDVWISPHANGHLQATGRDAKGRKQYRYHTDWSQARSETKYANLAGFGEGLADLRRWISAHLRPDQAGSRDFAIAAVLALIDRSSIRVGNEAYTRENGSFGATTLKPAHVEVEGSHIRLAFTAKGGKQVERQLTGRKLARVLHQLSDLPGGDLFTWLDDEGDPCVVTSEMVNDTIRAVVGDAHSAKTFRTWNGTHAAFEAAFDNGPISIKSLSEAASLRLQNTPTICRNSYIHPDVIALSELSDDDRHARLSGLSPAPVDGLRPHEDALLHYLRKD